MRVQLRMPAAPGTRYVDEAVAMWRGRTVPVDLESRPYGRGTVVDVQVVDGGAALLLDVDVDDNDLPSPGWARPDDGAPPWGGGPC